MNRGVRGWWWWWWWWWSFLYSTRRRHVPPRQPPTCGRRRGGYAFYPFPPLPFSLSSSSPSPPHLPLPRGWGGREGRGGFRGGWARARGTAAAVPSPPPPPFPPPFFLPAGGGSVRYPSVGGLSVGAVRGASTHARLLARSLAGRLTHWLTRLLGQGGGSHQRR